MLTIEVTPERYSNVTPPRGVFDLRLPASRICAILDSPESWGHGQEAANLVRVRLESQWRSLSSLDPDRASRDLASAVAELPEALVEADWGCSFSAAILFISGDAVSFLAAGALRIVVFTPSETVELFRPDTLADQLVEHGQITREEATTHPYRAVLIGQFVDPSSPHISVSGPFRLPQESLLVVAPCPMIEAVQGLPYSNLCRLNGEAFQDHVFSQGVFRGAVIFGHHSAAT